MSVLDFINELYSLACDGVLTSIFYDRFYLVFEEQFSKGLSDVLNLINELYSIGYGVFILLFKILFYDTLKLFKGSIIKTLSVLDLINEVYSLGCDTVFNSIFNVVFFVSGLYKFIYIFLFSIYWLLDLFLTSSSV